MLIISTEIIVTKDFFDVKNFFSCTLREEPRNHFCLRNVISRNLLRVLMDGIFPHCVTFR